MKHKNSGVFLIAGLISAFSSTAPVMSYATDTFTVPAASCSPFRSDHADNLLLVGGFWKFKDKAIGTATLECPYSGGAADAGFTDASAMFRDSDGTGTAAQVRVRFLRRSNGVLNASAWFSSNTVAGTTHQTVDMGIGAQTIGTSEIGSFQVQISRSSTAQSAIFDGIVLNEAAPVM